MTRRATDAARGSRGRAENSQHRARKRFGQHFLHDDGVIRRILHALAPEAGQALVEIGPGLGALTLPLLQRVGTLQAVELDRDVIPLLREQCAALGDLRLHSADALSFDFRTLAAADQRLRIVGNLPYNISTPLLFHLIDQLNCIQDMHFMLQKEVVERMAACPGNGDYGRLSVMVQLHCEVIPLFDIGRGAFRPPPKVESRLVRLLPHTQPPVDVRDQRLLAKLVTQVFSQRRKTLRNGLKGLLDVDQIKAAGVDPGERPEQLSLVDFAALSNQYSVAQARATGAGATSDDPPTS